MFNRTKTYVLAILILIAICQMFELWFDDYSSRNFFYNVISNNFTKSDVTLEYKYQLEPIEIVISFGNKQYALVKSDDAVKKSFDAEFEKLFNLIISDEMYVNEENVNMKEFLDKQAILYEYPVRVNSIASINSNYDQDNKNIKQIGEFNKIILQPSTSGYGDSKCFFVDEQSNIMKRVNLKYNSKILSDSINAMQNKNMPIIYNTEYDSNKQYFYNINFIPGFKESDVFMNTNAITKNPFWSNNTLDEKKVEEYVNYFFDNPSAKWNFKKENGMTVYADGEKTIKFFDSGIVEYVNSRAFEKDSYVSFEAAYQIASAFMEKDSKYMYPNLYLASAKRISDSEWDLSFGIKLDSYRFIMSGDLATNIGLKYPIEVVVKNNRVVSYKRLIREFYFKSEFEQIKIKNYPEALEEIINNKKENKNIKIKNMFLSYYAENIEQNPKLTWIVETADTIYAVDAIKKDESEK